MLRKFSLIFLVIVLALSAMVSAAQEAPVYVGIGFEPADNGITVTELDPRGPAAGAGVKIGDVITAIGGEPVTAETVVETLSQYQPGDEITLSVERAGETQDITVKLAPRDNRRNEPRPMPRLDVRPMLGVRLVENEAGAEITEVAPNTAAEKAGLKVGDVITAINGEAVTTPQQAQELIGKFKAGDIVTVTVTRDGESMDIEATLGTLENRDFRIPPLDRGQGGFMMPVQPGLFNYLPDENVYEVGEMPENNPYYEAGLRSGDRITAINGDSVSNMLFNLHGEETVTVTVERDGETQEIDVPGTIVLEMLMGGMQRGMFMPDVAPLKARLGLMFDMQPDGAYVRAVDPDSPAAEAGITEGDIITALDGNTLSADFTLRDAMVDKNPGDEVTLTVLRDGETQEIKVTLGEPQAQFNFEHPAIPGEGRPRT